MQPSWRRYRYSMPWQGMNTVVPAFVLRPARAHEGVSLPPHRPLRQYIICSVVRRSTKCLFKNKHIRYCLRRSANVTKLLFIGRVLKRFCKYVRTAVFKPLKLKSKLSSRSILRAEGYCTGVFLPLPDGHRECRPDSRVRVVSQFCRMLAPAASSLLLNR